jgi:hypothetical protein
MITVTSTTNAPGTTIRVHSICLNFTLADSFVNLSVRLLDGYGQLIRLPQPVRQMTPTETNALMALGANASETLSQFVARAAAPYIEAVYGITYTTV